MRNLLEKLSRQQLITTILGIMVIVGFMAIAGFWVNDSNDTTSGFSLFSPVVQVSSGSFDIFIVETATLDAKQSVTLSSELPSNSAKIMFLVPEGDYIEKGALVAKFDPTSFTEDIDKAKNNIKEAGALLQQTEADLKLQEHDGKDRIAKFEYQIELSKLKLKALREADFPMRRAKAEKDFASNQAEHERMQQQLDTAEELFAKGFVKKTALQEARDNAQDKATAFKISRQSLTNLNEITLPGELRQAELDLSNRERELQTYRSVQVQKILKQDAAVLRMRSRVTALEQALKKHTNHLNKTSLYASVSGIVRYQPVSFAKEKRKVQVGDSVWTRQGFAVIPDMSSMVAYVDVRESDVGKLAVGHTAVIKPEAYPKLTLNGVVETIGTLAADTEATDQSKLFRVRIGLQNSDSRLRPGMTAKTSILAKHYDESLRVPVEAIFYDGQQPVCFLWRDGHPLRKPVILGASDGDYVVIEDGVEAGQEVMLIYPDRFKT